MRPAVTVFVLVLMAGGLAGCSGGDDYCDHASDLNENYGSLDFTALSDKQYEALLDDLDALADSAPDDVEADWRTLREAASTYGAIVNDAGISFDELRSLLAGENVAGVSDNQRRDLERRLEEYQSNAAYPAAGQALKQNLIAECDLDLSAGPAR